MKIDLDYSVLIVITGVFRGLGILEGHYIDPALVSDVANQSTTYAGAFETMKHEWVWQDNQSLEGEVKAIDNQIAVINALIARIEKEMPEIKPPKMNHLVTEDFSP